MTKKTLSFVCLVMLSAATLSAEAESAVDSNALKPTLAEVAVKTPSSAGAAVNQTKSLPDAIDPKRPAADAAKTQDAVPPRKSDETDANQSCKAFVQEIMSKLPGGAVNITKDYSGKTWLVNGVYAKGIDLVKKEISDAMRADRYQLLHEIPLTADQSRVLVAWQKKDTKLIFLIWKKSEKETGFSWGRTQ